MAFPNSKSDNSGELLHDAQNEIISIVNAVADFEPVIMFSNSETLTRIKFAVSKKVVVLHVAETSHLWMRDFGPIFVRTRDGKSLRGVDFNFNYWGGKRTPSGDDLIAEIAAQYVSGSSVLPAVMTVTGGGMEVDGEGTFMATESAVLNENRNPGRTRVQLESELTRLLGVHKFLWLTGEAGKETTDCHIDALARFVRPGVIILSKPFSEGRGKYQAAYMDAKMTLSNATDGHGRRLVVHDRIEPDLGKLERVPDGENCVASYVNFLFVNGGIIIPKFGDGERDAQALALFQRLRPDRKVVQVYINALPCIGGAIHCATQQVPNLN